MDKQLQLSQLEKTEQVIRKEQEAKLKYAETILPHPGHKIWEVHIKNKTIRPAEYEVGPVVFNPNGDPFPTRGRLIILEDCVYIAALNRKNAIKKFKQFRNGSRIDPHGKYLKLVILK